MRGQRIVVLANAKNAILFGLLGLETRIIEFKENFLTSFKELTRLKSVGMIIISLELPEETIDYIIEFKLNRNRPFIFYMSDILDPKLGKEDKIYNEIYRSISKIVK